MDFVKDYIFAGSPLTGGWLAVVCAVLAAAAVTYDKLKKRRAKDDSTGPLGD